MEPWVLADKDDLKELVGDNPIFVRIKDIVSFGNNDEYHWVYEYSDKDQRYVYFVFKKFEHPEFGPGKHPTISKRTSNKTIWVESAPNKAVEIPIGETFREGFEDKRLFLCF